MPSQSLARTEHESAPDAVRTALQRTGSTPSPDVIALLAQVDRLRGVPGVAVSARFDTIRDGIGTLATLEGTLAADALDTLTDVTCRNDTEAIALAYTAALAAQSDARHSASSTVQQALLGELRDEYGRSAEDNYAAVAAAFDAEVEALTAAAGIVDLRLAAVDVLHATKEERAAWLTAEQVAGRLDEHAALLRTAAEATGQQLADGSHRLDVETDQWLQLCVDVSGQDRRRLWEVWDAPGHDAAGRWGGLLLAGIRIRAAPLAEVQPYGRPLPVESGPEGRATAAVGRRISWLHALALLGLGCLSLGLAAAATVFAAGFTVAALLEPRDVLLAAREALAGTLLLGGGLSAGLAWALLAAVGYEAGGRRRTSASLSTDPRRGGAMAL
jgi:hypothetical protein